MKKYRVRRKFVHKTLLDNRDKRVINYHRYNRFCGVGICCSGGLTCVVIIGVMIVVLFLFSNSCVEHSDCKTSNPCSIDTCHNNICYHDRKKNCCSRDIDCGGAQCYDSFCDLFTHTCNVVPQANGTRCRDSDSCTVNDQCFQGQCIGNVLSCTVSNNNCIHGWCMKSQGCVFENNQDGIDCDDNNPCTIQDKCYNGICAAIPKDCSHLDSVCSIGACDVVSGSCISIDRNEGLECDDGLSCTIHDTCSNGVCVGEDNLCFDNNPCTINICSEELGCLITHTVDNEQCIPGCTKDEECPLSYICYDGTCIKTPNPTTQHIAMIGYEIEECTNATYSRLIQHFVLDTKEIIFNGETRYRIVKDTSEIVINDAFAPLGFGDDIINLASNHFGNGIARTTFSIATECQVFTPENCKFIFANREYRFFAYTHDCLDINGMASGCIKMNHMLDTSISLSLSTCTQFPGQVDVIHPYGRAAVIYHGITYREPHNDITQTDNTSFGIVGLETNTAYNVLPVIRSMRVCQGDVNHHLGGCVDGTNRTECFNIGCYGWDPEDSPLSFKVDIIQDSIVTALALSDSFLASGCYNNDDYNIPDKCVLDKCDNYGMDDYFEFLFKEFNNEEYYVFDIKYKWSYCNSTRRRLLSTMIDQYAMTKIKFN